MRAVLRHRSRGTNGPTRDRVDADDDDEPTTTTTATTTTTTAATTTTRASSTRSRASGCACRRRASRRGGSRGSTPISRRACRSRSRCARRPPCRSAIRRVRVVCVDSAHREGDSSLRNNDETSASHAKRIPLFHSNDATSPACAALHDETVQRAFKRHTTTALSKLASRRTPRRRRR